MRVIITFLFGVLIFILTCTENVHELILYQQLHFKFNHSPDYREFFNLTGYPFTSPVYLTQKIGHGLFFCVFSFLLGRVPFKLYIVLSIAISYAIVTEIAQLFFTRTGCLLDVLYDTFGVLFYCVIALIFLRLKKYYRSSKLNAQNIRSGS